MYSYSSIDTNDFSALLTIVIIIVEYSVCIHKHSLHMERQHEWEKLAVGGNHVTMYETWTSNPHSTLRGELDAWMEHQL